MRLFGEPDYTGAGLTFHTRFFTFSYTHINGCVIWVRNAFRINENLAYLVGSLPSYWMEMPFGKSPLRFIADMRRGNRSRVA